MIWLLGRNLNVQKYYLRAPEGVTLRDSAKTLALRSYLSLERFFTDIYYLQINERNKQKMAVVSNLVKAADILLKLQQPKEKAHKL